MKEALMTKNPCTICGYDHNSTQDLTDDELIRMGEIHSLVESSADEEDEKFTFSVTKEQLGSLRKMVQSRLDELGDDLESAESGMSRRNILSLIDECKALKDLLC